MKSTAEVYINGVRVGDSANGIVRNHDGAAVDVLAILAREGPAVVGYVQDGRAYQIHSTATEVAAS